MNKVTFTINGKQLQVREGMTILEAARENHIKIPTLCYRKHINEIGSCRLCMVEAKGFDCMLPACKTKVKEGLEINLMQG